MDGQPDTLSFGPQRLSRRPVAPAQPRRLDSHRCAIAVVLACLGVTVSLALLVAHQDDTIDQLRSGALRSASTGPAPATAAQPTVSGSAMFGLPGAGGGSFSVVVVAVRPEPTSAHAHLAVCLRPSR